MMSEIIGLIPWQWVVFGVLVLVGLKFGLISLLLLLLLLFNKDADDDDDDEEED